MYKEKLVAVIKVNGKVLREHGDTVYIPFGSEYEILLKNLESRGVVVSISIDGVDVLDGEEIYIRPNSDTTLEGFLDRRSGKVRNRFRFIEKTDEISEYRGDRVEDGLVVIKYKFEKEIHPIYRRGTWEDYFPKNPITPYQPILYKSSDCSNESYYNDIQCSTLSCNSMPIQKSYNDNGITVEGSESNQKFHEVSVNNLESIEYTIVIRLKGEVENHIIEKPITVSRKFICPTCGRKNESLNKYCSNCGTALFVSA